MQENQNAFQNAGSNGYFYYVSIANQSSTFFVLVLAFVMLIALFKSEERYRKLVESIYLAAKDNRGDND